jgi:hypothetical protein
MPQPTSPFDDPVYALVLINLDTCEGFNFKVFPETIEVNANAQWKPQAITRGTQPLLYGSNEPEKISFNCWLDRSAEEDGSVTPDIAKLTGWMKPADGRGAPPPLLLSWGDSEVRCVLDELKATERYFDSTGKPRRAELNVTFTELQEERAPEARNLAAPSSPPSPVPSGQVSGGRVFGPEP